MLKVNITFFRFLFIFACLGLVFAIAILLFLAGLFFFWFQHELKLRQSRYNETQQLLQDIDSEYRSTGRF